MGDNAATMVRLLSKVKNLAHACEQEWQVKNEKIILICFDSNDEFSKTIEDAKIQLHNIHDSVVFLTDLPSCMTFIQSNEQNKLFLLTTDSSIDDIVQRASEWKQLVGIFILNLRKSQQDSTAHECSKLTSIDDDFQSLCASIAREIDLADQLLPIWCFFNQDTWAKRDLYKYPSSFLWLQLLHDVLLYLPRDESAMKQMIDIFRQYYRENTKALQSIDQFEDEYQSNEAVHQYLNNSFLRKMITKALRTENTDQIYRMRYFLRDLVDGIPHVVRSTSKNVFVYRAMQMCHGEFSKLRNNQHQLMAMKGFLIATRSRSEALATIDRISPSSNLNTILFEIEWREPAMARSSEEQVLFDMNTTFQLDSIGKKGAYWQVRLSVVDDGQVIKQKYIDDVHRQTEEVAIPILFGRYLCDMSQWDQSQLYFEHLLSQPYDEDLAWIMHGLGRAHQCKSQWLEARKYHDWALNRMMQAKPSRRKDSALVLSNLGEMLYFQGSMDEAYDLNQQALEIRRTFYPANHVSIASHLESIALVRFEQQLDDEALDLVQQAQRIRDEHDQRETKSNGITQRMTKFVINGVRSFSSHFKRKRSKTDDRFQYLTLNLPSVDVGIHLGAYGVVLVNQHKYDEALYYYCRSIAILEQYYPSGHLSLVLIISGIGLLLYKQERYDEAYDIIRSALAMKKRWNVLNHSYVALALFTMRFIKTEQGKYDDALDYCQEILTIFSGFDSSPCLWMPALLSVTGLVRLHAENDHAKVLEFQQRALSFLETHYPSYHSHIADILDNIGWVLRDQRNYNEAYNFHKKALTLRESFYSTSHYSLARSHQYISYMYYELKEFDQALQASNKALTIQQKYYGFDDVNIAQTQIEIGRIHHCQGMYDEAIKSYQQAVSIFRKSSPFYQASLAQTLENISETLFEQRNYDQAFVYRQQALAIREVHYPTVYSQIATCLDQLGTIRRAQNRVDEAIAYWQSVLEIYTRYESVPYLDYANKLIYMGHVQFSEANYGEAITYYSDAGLTLRTHCPTNHIWIAANLLFTADAWTRLEEHELALETYQTCLEVQEASLPAGQSTVANTLGYIVGILERTEQYELALAYELRRFLINEKLLPPDHQDIGASLSRIGRCYELLQKHAHALEYYKRADSVYTQCLPEEDDDRQTVQLNIIRLNDLLNNHLLK